jgi:hypothetical protein
MASEFAQRPSVHCVTTGRRLVSVSPSPAIRLVKERGQALVFSLVTLIIIILVMATMYSMGQQAINKMKLQNTADAAAYSAVLAEARDYNFTAYTNRAMIANQVAVAQVVSLTSWARNYGNTYDGPTSWIPGVLTSLGGGLSRVTWDPPWRASKAVSKTFRSAFNTIGPATTKVLDALIDVLKTAQTIHHYGSALTVAQIIGLSPAQVLSSFAGVDASSLGVLQDLLTFNNAYNIIKLNDPNANISTTGVAAGIMHMAQWFLFTNKKDPNTADKDGAKGDRMAQVTVDSLDGFTKERSTKGGGPAKNFPEMMYLLPITIDPTRFIPYQSGGLLMYLWHRGGTELKNINNAKKTWSAMDGTGFFGIGIFWISIIGIPIPIPIPFPFIPMGYGAAQAGPDAPLDTQNFATPAADAYGKIFGNVNTAGAAGIQKGKGAGATLDSGAGLRTYFDVKKAEAGKDNLVGPPLILEIEKGAANIPNSNSISGGQFTLTNGTRSNYMRSLTKAEVYFSRPPKLWARGDSKTELGSLYSPYWQARLLPNSFVEQYISLAFHLL